MIPANPSRKRPVSKAGYAPVPAHDDIEAQGLHGDHRDEATAARAAAEDAFEMHVEKASASPGRRRGHVGVWRKGGGCRGRSCRGPQAVAVGTGGCGASQGSSPGWPWLSNGGPSAALLLGCRC